MSRHAVNVAENFQNCWTYRAVVENQTIKENFEGMMETWRLLVSCNVTMFLLAYLHKLLLVLRLYGSILLQCWSQTRLQDYTVKRFDCNYCVLSVICQY